MTHLVIYIGTRFSKLTPEMQNNVINSLEIVVSENKPEITKPENNLDK